jgi:uncharacterized protein YdgA (DUF945 family)
VKKITPLKLILSILVVLILLVGILCFWSGKQAEKSLERQFKYFNGLPWWNITHRTYEKGWFSSKEKGIIQFTPEVKEYINLLPDSIKEGIPKEIAYEHTIKHGPFPGVLDGVFRPAWAKIETRFDFGAAATEHLKIFFGTQDILTSKGFLWFSGASSMHWSIPKFNYQEKLAGVQINWGGLDWKTTYSKDYRKEISSITIPKVNVSVNEYGHFDVTDILYQSDTLEGKHGITIGSRKFDIYKLEWKWLKDIPYTLKFNQWVNIFTQINLGDFINPNGYLKSGSLLMQKIKYDSQLQEENDFINAKGLISIDDLQHNEMQSGPLRINIEADHLHAPTLFTIQSDFSKLPSVQGREQEEDWNKAFSNMLSVNGSVWKLFIHDPILKIKEVYLKTSSGEIIFNGELALKNLENKDRSSIHHFLKKVYAHANFKIPQPILEYVVLSQARRLFTVDETASEQPDIEAIDGLVRNILNSMLLRWKQQGLIKQEQGYLDTQLDIKAGILTLNGIKVNLDETSSLEENMD